MVLDTVGDYLSNARTLLQDSVQPYRYPDADLLAALNMALGEAWRVRPDIFLNQKYTSRSMRVQPSSSLTVSVPSYSLDGLAESVVWPRQYALPVLYFIVGQAQLRDTEDTQDVRASAFLTKFIAQLLTLGA